MENIKNIDSALDSLKEKGAQEERARILLLIEEMKKETDFTKIGGVFFAHEAVQVANKNIEYNQALTDLKEKIGVV